jgi:hypothetical protein
MHSINTGDTFNRLTVESVVLHPRRYKCQCICGNHNIVSASDLVNGRIKSCGCLQREAAARRFLKHGATSRLLNGSKRQSAEYVVWQGMMARCRPSNASKFRHHAGRGITVCDRWHSFESFILDMGQRPYPKATIERINNDIGYQPDNCRWASWTDQANNKQTSKRYTVNGVTGTRAELCRHFGMRYGAVKQRMNTLGWTIEAALSVPHEPFRTRARRA